MDIEKVVAVAGGGLQANFWRCWWFSEDNSSDSPLTEPLSTDSGAELSRASHWIRQQLELRQILDTDSKSQEF